MDRRLASQVEIETLHEILPELDYYRLLQIEPGVAQDLVDPAFRRESRRLHPDRFASFDGPVRDKANDIYRAVGEAHRVLKEPESRSRYDLDRASGTLRVTNASMAAAAKERAVAADPSQAATHPKSEKYWKMALTNWEEANYKGCVLQIQLALTFEPNNAVFLEWMEKARAAADEKAKKNDNPYKIRLT